MSLIDDFMCDLVLMERSTVSDKEGGTVSTWTEGNTIKGAITLDSSLSARIAEKDGLTSVYTITTDKSVTLRFHDVLKRSADGAIFRVTSKDKRTPKSAGLDMAQVSAEEWALD